MPFLPRRSQPGDEIHYIALLDEEGNTVTTLPMEKPTVIPADADPPSVSVSVYLTIRGATR